MKTILAMSVIVLGLGLMTGCDEASSVPSQPSAKRSAPPPPPPVVSQSPDKTAAVTVPKTAKTQQVKAQVGVAKQGRSLDDPGMIRMIVAPARAYFRTRERIVFEVQVPKALQLYKALNGASPKTHQEFMDGVIKANQIPLPDLPPGSRYIYSPEDEQLMVERPAKRMR